MRQENFPGAEGGRDGKEVTRWRGQGPESRGVHPQTPRKVARPQSRQRGAYAGTAKATL